MVSKLNKEFSIDERQLTEKNLKIYSTFLVLTEMKNQTYLDISLYTCKNGQDQ